MRKMTITFLCLMVAFSVFAKGTHEEAAPEVVVDASVLEPFSKYDETVHFTQGIAEPVLTKLPAGDTLEDNMFTRYILDKINVDVDYAWTTTGDAYTQKITLCIANGEIPDVLLVQKPTLDQLVEADLILPLDNLYETTVCNQIKDYYDSYNGRILDGVIYDGKMMALPSCNLSGEHMLTWVRQDWLDKLGLEGPKTMDDIVKIAKAFIEQDPDGNGKDDTIGIPVPSYLVGYYNWMFLLDTVFALNDAYPRQWIRNDEGEIVYGSVQPEVKETLAYLAELYEEGIIDKQFAIRQAGNDAATLIASGKCGIMFGPWFAPGWPLSDSVKNDSSADWKPFIAPVGDDGKINTIYQVPSTWFLVINKNCKHPEAVIKTLNVVESARKGLLNDAVKFTSPEFSTAGIWPVDLLLDYEDAIFRFSSSLREAIAAGTDENLSPFYKGAYDAYMKNAENPRTDVAAWAEKTARYDGQFLTSPEYVNRKDVAFTGRTESMELRWGSLEKMFDEVAIKIIMGEVPVDEFDKFVTDWYAAGGEQITEEIRVLCD